jgi:hypothetical protein
VQQVKDEKSERLLIRGHVGDIYILNFANIISSQYQIRSKQYKIYVSPDTTNVVPHEKIWEEEEQAETTSKQATEENGKKVRKVFMQMPQRYILIGWHHDAAGSGMMNVMLFVERHARIYEY